MSRQDIRKFLFALAAGVVMISTALTACAASTPQPLAEPTNPPASPSVEAPQEVQRITLEESKAAFDSSAALFLDVRRADSYTASHIPGALSIPLDELETRITELDPDQWIITYCT
jgi:3-mercaptopyruvate sulfurtransferase SseA